MPGSIFISLSPSVRLSTGQESARSCITVQFVLRLIIIKT